MRIDNLIERRKSIILTKKEELEMEYKEAQLIILTEIMRGLRKNG